MSDANKITADELYRQSADTKRMVDHDTHSIESFDKFVKIDAQETVRSSNANHVDQKNMITTLNDDFQMAHRKQILSIDRKKSRFYSAKHPINQSARHTSFVFNTFTEPPIEK